MRDLTKRVELVRLEYCPTGVVNFYGETAHKVHALAAAALRVVGTVHATYTVTSLIGRRLGR